jgi:sporulation protein YlmC with PRC-barrel domain
MLEDLHIGSAVIASDGTRLGTLTRVIVDSDTDRVLGLVVDPGLAASGNLLAPGGWDRPRERVVGTDLVAAVSHEAVRIQCDQPAFQQLPHFEHDQFVDVDPAGLSGGHARFHLGDLLNYAASEFGLGGAPYVPPAQVTRDEPPSAGAIAQGTPVYRLQPLERIGEVQEILVDAGTQKVISLVLKRGFPPKHVVLPTSAIAAILDDMVQVRLTDDELDNLPLYVPNQ